MPDLLAHVFVAYAVVRPLSWRFDWLDSRYITIVLVGAFIPDLAKIDLLVSDAVVVQMFGLPFDWRALQTLGGVVVLVLIGVVLVNPQERTAVGALLFLGAGTHLFTDGLLLTPSGRVNAVFWPLTRYHPPTPGLYLSTQLTPTTVAALGAVAVWLAPKARIYCRRFQGESSLQR